MNRWKPILLLRSGLFYFGYFLATLWFSLTAVAFLSRASYSLRSRYLCTWNVVVLAWLRLTCGVRTRVLGLENLPPGPCVLLSKHQSQWETYFLLTIKRGVVPVLKQELLAIPGFGWGLRLMEPIAIDRSNPKQALRQISEQGNARLAAGLSVLVFPEGTRTRPGEQRPYARGGAGLAIRAGVPVVPIALNAGHCWPADGFLKYPGTITVSIGPPIDSTDRDSRSLTEEAKVWIEEEMAQLD